MAKRRLHGEFRKWFLYAMPVAVFFAAAPTSAQGQAATFPNCRFSGSADALIQSFNPNLASGGGAAAGALASVLGTMNTAFLSQTSAFIGDPPNPPPNASNAGTWMRTIGGFSNTTTSTTSTSQNTAPAFAGPPPFPGQTLSGSAECSIKLHQTYAGFQVGQDLAKLNVDGWNIHGGITAGYAESTVSAREIGFSGTFQVPFYGLYAAVLKGGFFADALVRWDSYQNKVTFPAGVLVDKPFDARASSLSVSAGYHLPLASWFVEPIGTFIYSRLAVDPISAAGNDIATNSGVSTAGTTSFNTLHSLLGRVGARIGTTIPGQDVTLQPFAAIDLWHEFAGQAIASARSCEGCAYVGSTAPNHVPVTLSGTVSATRVGTYVQLALGVVGQLTGTGWLGYARADLREGSKLEGAGVNAGLRYQFTPEASIGMSAAKIFRKAPAAQTIAHDWTGLYVGGLTGGMHTVSDWVLVQTGSSIKNKSGGLLGGIEAGYNVQMNSFVWGLEGDIAWTNARANKTGSGATTGAAVTGNPPNTFPFGLPPSPFAFGTTPTCTSRIDLSCQDSVDWIASLAGRVGYTWDRTLVFIKGGGAWMHGAAQILDTYPLVSAVTTIGPVCHCVLAQSADQRIGFLVGAGFEFAYTTNWSVKAEYNFLDFGSRTLAFSDGEQWNIKRQFSLAKLGLNYRLAAY